MKDSARLLSWCDWDERFYAVTELLAPDGTGVASFNSIAVSGLPGSLSTRRCATLFTDDQQQRSSLTLQHQRRTFDTNSTETENNTSRASSS